MSIYRILLDAEPVEGGNDPKPEPKPEPKAPTLESARAAAEKLDVDGFARKLLELQEDNFKYRQRLREAEGRLPEGSLVLKGDDAKAWSQYRDLGRPQDIRTMLDERKTLSEWKRGREQADTLAEAARLHGWKPSVLTRFAKADGLEVVVDDDPEAKDQDGKPVRKGFVVTRGDDGQERRTPLDQYAGTQWQAELEVLREPPAKQTAADREDVRRPEPKDGDARPKLGIAF